MKKKETEKEKKNYEET